MLYCLLPILHDEATHMNERRCLCQFGLTVVGCCGLCTVLQSELRAASASLCWIEAGERGVQLGPRGAQRDD